MKKLIVMAFTSLTAYVLMATAQQPNTWTEPYFFYNYKTPLALPPQKTLVNEMGDYQKQLSINDDQIIPNTLESHVGLMSTCLRELKNTKADLAETHTVIDSMKKEMDHVKATVDTLIKKMNDANNATSIGRMPRSCDDLQRIGHIKSGLFSVMGNKTVDSVYCDFTKPISDADFQKAIGYVDVKTSPVYFHAQRSSPYSALNTSLPFNSLRLNLGGGMNTSGI